MIHAKDVLAHIGKPDPPSLKDLAREVLFVSPAMLVWTCCSTCGSSARIWPWSWTSSAA